MIITTESTDCEILGHPNMKNDECPCGSVRYRVPVVVKKYAARAPSQRWARDFDCCVECSTTERRHSSKGLCTRCKMRLKRAS